MGGSKNKSPAQKERAQKRDDAEQKKSKKSKADSKMETSVLINESQAMKYIKDAKVLTAQDLARHTLVKISTANLFLKKSLDNGIIRRIGGFSGHHVYQPISE